MRWRMHQDVVCLSGIAFGIAPVGEECNVLARRLEAQVGGCNALGNSRLPRKLMRQLFLAHHTFEVAACRLRQQVIGSERRNAFTRAVLVREVY